MVQWRAEGQSFDKIGRSLEERGIVGRKGQRISAKVIRGIIQRESR